jgi:hypothetical protein
MKSILCEDIKEQLFIAQYVDSLNDDSITGIVSERVGIVHKEGSSRSHSLHFGHHVVAARCMTHQTGVKNDRCD